MVSLMFAPMIQPRTDNVGWDDTTWRQNAYQFATIQGTNPYDDNDKHQVR